MAIVIEIGAAVTRLSRKHIPSPARISLLVTALSFGAIFGVQYIAKQEAQSTLLPQAIVSQIHNFTPYYFQGDISGGYTLKPNTVKFENDVLIFQIVNVMDKRTITVSQQTLPPALADETYPKAENVQGADGYAVIVYNKTQATGSLFSTAHDNKKTMVLLNTHNPIKKDTLADLLRSLRPLKY